MSPYYMSDQEVQCLRNDSDAQNIINFFAENGWPATSNDDIRAIFNEWSTYSAFLQTFGTLENYLVSRGCKAGLVPPPGEHELTDEEVAVLRSCNDAQNVINFFAENGWPTTTDDDIRAIFYEWSTYPSFDESFGTLKNYLRVACGYGVPEGKYVFPVGSRLRGTLTATSNSPQQLEVTVEIVVLGIMRGATKMIAAYSEMGFEFDFGVPNVGSDIPSGVIKYAGQSKPFVGADLVTIY